ncbi:SAM-dependent methyltransferase, MidA family [Ruegeria halocynthiae]|uniref:SAM-dependent methyltransferase, MidA family n=1 Tax=Ruegeria halocynthiae TaxID=985054 RepID=A0A1H2VQW4_9RHOB|nr:SAM-dependent methyltransferase [Ruegeria halocynthiae]SDW70219.1 SAM-dependent methyltransferase, MidA family [Ruegeria halocynthiae]
MNLKELLLLRIQNDGPMTVADYMTECLMHPDHGYYTTRDPLGAQGDFITAPEISQMFGELIGICLAQAWLGQGKPERFVLAELGPGRGTLMADILRATKGVPGFHNAAEIALLEASPTLRSIQSETLQGFEPRWIKAISDLPDLPLLLVANEFFDALPIRQFLRDGAGWRERLVGSDGTSLAFGLGPQSVHASLSERLKDTQDGDLVELCPAAIPILSTVAGQISRNGGAALIIDYGDWRSLGDTLQALQAHKSADPLGQPGQADLTAHVDFEILADAVRASGCTHTKLTPQGVFLERLGITPRAQSLAAPLSGPQLETLIAAHRRLTHPDEMGNLFKVLGLYPQNAAPPPGLEA